MSGCSVTLVSLCSFVLLGVWYSHASWELRAASTAQPLRLCLAADTITVSDGLCDRRFCHHLQEESTNWTVWRRLKSSACCRGDKHCHWLLLISLSPVVRLSARLLDCGLLNILVGCLTSLRPLLSNCEGLFFFFWVICSASPLIELWLDATALAFYLSLNCVVFAWSCVRGVACLTVLDFLSITLNLQLLCK